MYKKNYSIETKADVSIDLLCDPAVIADEKGRPLTANDAFEEVTGLGRKDLIGKSFLELEFVPAESKKTLLENLKKRMQGLPVQPYEIVFIDRNGKARYVEINARKINFNGQLADFVIFRDITERKRSEEALRRAEEKFRTIFENVHDVVTYVDKQGRILDVNSRVEGLLGYKRDEIIGKHFVKLGLIGLKDIPKMVRFFMSSIQKGEAQELLELELKHKNGNKVFVEVGTRLIKRNGKVEGVVNIYRDITERKKLQSKLADYSHNLEKIVEERTEQLRQTQDRLVKSERLATIGELAGMVGHDLRNPLTGIKNAAYYLKVKQDPYSDGDRRKMLEIIDNAINHADKIINDLLDYSREIRLELVDCSSWSILQEALSLVQIPDKVKIENRTHKEPVIKADRTKMVRACVNIVKNAVDAMPDGGTLEIKSIQKDGNVEISFADTGVGMSKETLAKLFSPLVTTKAQGMGFGLAICRRVVDAHQGRITVQSVKGKGSTFTVILPIEPKTKDEGEATWIDLPESSLSTTKT